MRIRPIVPAALLSIVLLFSSCSGSSEDGSSSTAASTSSAPRSTTTTSAPVATSRPPEVLDRGDEPRRALRVAYVEGTEASLTFTSDLEVAQTSDGRTQRLDSPPVTQTLTYAVGSVSEEGAAVTIRIDAIGVDGEGTGFGDDEIADLDATLEPMIGFEATGTVTPLGELIDLEFTGTEDLTAALAAQLAALEGQLAALGPSLPAEPVGIGASWRSTASRSVGGAEVESTSIVTVTALDERSLGYTTTVATTAEPQDIALDGLPDGTTARLVSSDLTGSSTGTMGLDAISVTLRARLGGQQELQLTSAEEPTALTQRIALAYAASTAPG